MSYRVSLIARYEWVPDGVGGTMLGQPQADNPGMGSAGATAGTVPGAQEASDIVAAIVPAGNSPANTDFQTALNNAAAALYTRFTTAGAVPGFTSGTLYAQVAGWSTGNP